MIISGLVVKVYNALKALMRVVEWRGVGEVVMGTKWREMWGELEEFLMI